MCYPQAHRRLSSASRRIAHSSAGDCRRYAKPAGESTQTDRRLTPSAQVESMVVGLEWSSPYRLKPTMMSDQAWMAVWTLRRWGARCRNRGGGKGVYALKYAHQTWPREKREKKHEKKEPDSALRNCGRENGVRYSQFI